LTHIEALLIAAARLFLHLDVLDGENPLEGVRFYQLLALVTAIDYLASHRFEFWLHADRRKHSLGRLAVLLFLDDYAPALLDPIHNNLRRFFRRLHSP